MGFKGLKLDGHREFRLVGIKVLFIFYVYFYAFLLGFDFSFFTKDVSMSPLTFTLEARAPHHTICLYSIENNLAFKKALNIKIKIKLNCFII